MEPMGIRNLAMGKGEGFRNTPSSILECGSGHWASELGLASRLRHTPLSALDWLCRPNVWYLLHICS